MNPVTIVVVDDHALVRETWCFILNAHPEFCVIGECGTGEDAVRQAMLLKPDVMIMDINLPGISGIEATSKILESGSTTKILGVSLHSDAEYALKIMQKGAMGYVTKNSAREEMYKAIIEIRAGRRYICEEIKAALGRGLESLQLPKPTAA